MELFVRVNELESAVRHLCAKKVADVCRDVAAVAQRAMESPGVKHFVAVDLDVVSIKCNEDKCELKLQPLRGYAPNYYVKTSTAMPGEGGVWFIGGAEVYVQDGQSLAELYRELQRYLARMLDATDELNRAEAMDAFDVISRRLDGLSDYANVDHVAFVQGREIDVADLDRLFNAQDLDFAKDLCTSTIGGDLCNIIVGYGEELRRAWGYARVQQGDLYAITARGAVHIRSYKKTTLMRIIGLAEFAERHCKLGDARYYLGGKEYGAKTPEELLQFLKDLRAWLQRHASYNEARLVEGKIRVMEELIAYEVERELKNVANTLLRKATIAIRIANSFENRDVAKELVENVIKAVESIAEKLKAQGRDG